MIEKPQDTPEIEPFVPAEPFVPTNVLEQSVQSERRVMGLTVVQRFFVMLLIFILTILLGSLFLVMSGKIVF